MVQYIFDQSQHVYEESRPNKEERSVGQGGGQNSYDWMDTLRSPRDEIRSDKEDNERLVIRAQQKQAKVNEIILRSLLDMEIRGNMSWGLVIETDKALWN